ncbi:MAG: hypothetical protein NC117_00625 [Pseudoflavonifractor sp.]|nr:hypothetical protein [Pseudoflavonifractor sp.]
MSEKDLIPIPPAGVDDDTDTATVVAADAGAETPDAASVPVPDESPAATEFAGTTLTDSALVSLIGRDARVGHFIVDVLAGMAPEAASRTHFAAVDTPQADISAAIEEAEQRGYLRGRNERIVAEMERPGLWEDPAVTAASDSLPVDNGPMILSGTRRSVWE